LTFKIAKPGRCERKVAQTSLGGANTSRDDFIINDWKMEVDVGEDCNDYMLGF
jgi:hypothetical protein